MTTRKRLLLSASILAGLVCVVVLVLTILPLRSRPNCVAPRLITFQVAIALQSRDYDVQKRNAKVAVEGR